MSPFGLESASTSLAESRCNGIRESLLLTLVLYSMVRGSQALAGDQLSLNDAATRLDVDHPQHRFDAAPRSFAAPLDFSAPRFSAKPLTNVEIFSETEFRPRRHQNLDAASSRNVAAIIDAPMTRDNSLWQQMGEFKSQDRLRLLTLWQTRGSSLSLQAGRRGAPSLQWSTPWVRRESASRAMFDHLLVISPRVFDGGTRNSAARPAPSALGPSKSVETNTSLSSK